MSISALGAQSWSLHAGVAQANRVYLVAGSLSGTSPGLNLPFGNVPLNPDPYFFYTLTSPGIPLSPTTGTFDAWGRAYASFTVPPSSNPHLVGLQLHHAYGVFDATTLQVELVSPPIPISLLP